MLSLFLVIGVLLQQTFAEGPERIVGGRLAVPGEFPHQCSLRYNGNYICGGSIITQTKILTTASCVRIASSSYGDLKVATGSTFIFGGQSHDVANAVIHPKYSDRKEDGWVHDIAVLTLSAPIQYNRYQKSIALTNSQPIAGQQCTLTGWGATSKDGPPAFFLHKINQAVVVLSECQSIYSSVLPLTDNHLCALNQPGIGACLGDSGSPLISNGVQIGIFSSLVPCAKGIPDIYTSVYSHLDFISSA